MREPYRPPQLTVYGRLRELTLGAGGANLDADGTCTTNRTGSVACSVPRS
jgi:hypothetical protein